jgi:hypothetical protein
MPRKVVRRGALAALTSLLLLAVPAAARAESLWLAPGSDPVAGQPSGIDYEYDSAGVDMNLTIVARPASGPPCAATSGVDAAAVGASGGSAYVTPTPIAVNGRGLGRVPFTFATPGSYRLCGWLARTPDDVAAVGVADVDVRLPRASLTVTARELAPKAGGADVLVHVTGSLEAAADVYVTAVGGGTACPPSYDEDTDPVALDPAPAGTPSRVTGGFDLSFQTRELLAFRTWRICAYLQDGTTAPAASATASALVDLVLRPALLRRPRVRQKGAAITCDGGRWKARPPATYGYAWLAGSRRIAGAKGRRLAVKPALRGKAIRCRVTARNRIGATTATSKAVTAR